jgi:hypothetical protein
MVQLLSPERVEHLERVAVFDRLMLLLRTEGEKGAANTPLFVSSLELAPKEGPVTVEGCFRTLSRSLITLLSYISINLY